MASGLVCREALSENVDTICEYQLRLAFETEELHLGREICRKRVQAVLKNFKNSHLGKSFIAEINGAIVGSLLIILQQVRKNE